MNNLVFGETIENARKHRDIKLITTEKRRNYLVSGPNYHTTKFFIEKILAILMNMPVYLGLLILDLSRTVMYEFWYDYAKAKYDEKQTEKQERYWCNDVFYTDSFIVYLKADDIYKEIAEDVKTRFDNSSYELERPLLKRKTRKLLVHRDESCTKTMKEFVELGKKRIVT